MGKVKGLSTKEKELLVAGKKFPQKMWPLSSRGGGGKALVARNIWTIWTEIFNEKKHRKMFSILKTQILLKF